MDHCRGLEDPYFLLYLFKAGGRFSRLQAQQLCHRLKRNEIDTSFRNAHTARIQVFFFFDPLWLRKPSTFKIPFYDAEDKVAWYRKPTLLIRFGQFRADRKLIESLWYVCMKEAIEPENISGYKRSDSLVNDSWKWIFCQHGKSKDVAVEKKGHVKPKRSSSLSTTVGSRTFARHGKLEDVVKFLTGCIGWEIVWIEQV